MFPRRRAGTTAGIPPRHLGIGADGPGGLGGAGAGEGGPVAAMASRMGRLGMSEDPVRFPRPPSLPQRVVLRPRS